MVIAAPMVVERLALRGARTKVVRTGMGVQRSLRSRQALGDAAVIVAGVGGSLAPHVRVGHVVVASEVRGHAGPVVPCDGTSLLVDELRRAGLSVHYGPVISTLRLGSAKELARLAETGALAVDMESWWLAPPPGTPFAVVRAISDGIDQPLFRPAIVHQGVTALRALRRAVPALDAWAERDSGRATGGG
jgi:4-hydroxy-3-methylbut-2-enyl diphosphate reductase